MTDATQQKASEVGAGETAIPSVGFGTYRMGGSECFEAVQCALEAGYRHVDTAMAYENEAAVGRALEVSPVDREEVFLTTKLKGYPEFLEYESALEQTDGCLQRLGVESVDLLLVHWWHPDGDMERTFAALDRLVDEGKVGHIGVSNFSTAQLERAMSTADAPILTNQVEHHPYWVDGEMRSFCAANDVTLTAYSPMAEGLLVDDDDLRAVGQRYDKTPAQVAVRWLIQQEDVVTIPKASTPEHIRQNRDVFDFELTDREMAVVENAEAPLWYRTNRAGGSVHRLRGLLGSAVPSAVEDRL